MVFLAFTQFEAHDYEKRIEEDRKSLAYAGYARPK